MAQDIDHLHHVGLVSFSLDDAAALYQRLGFQLTPPSEHVVASREGESPKPLGTANVIATFPRSYVEILAQVRDDVPTRVLDPWLARFPGLHVLALHTPDADAVATRLSAAGISHGGVSTLGREVDTLDGPQMMRVRNVMFGGEDPEQRVVAWSGESLPEGGVQAVQNLTPEYLLQPRYMEHPNGAIGLVESILCVEEARLLDLERRYAKYLGRVARHDGPRHSFDLDGCRVTIVADTAVSEVLPGEHPPSLPAFAGYAVAVRDLSATRKLLQAAGFPLKEAPSDSILVPSSAALGGAILFTGERP